MKNLFKHRKNENEAYDEEMYEDEYYEEDETYEGDEAEYAEEEIYEGDEVEYAEEEIYEGDEAEYAEEEIYEGDEVEYAEEEIYEGDEAEYAEEEIYEGDEAEYAEEEIYEDDEEDIEYIEGESYEEGDEIYAEDDSYYEDDDAYYEDEAYEDEDYDNEEDEEEEKAGFFAWLAAMTVMDKVMLGTGVGVVLLAIVTGLLFIQWRGNANQFAQLATVGSQLEGIEVVGDRGLLAVADATLAKMEALKVVEDSQTSYEEAEYNKNVTVVLKMVSVQKDLKIKFVNKSSEKLIPNVPFSVTVTTADNKTETWTDDDMDGIIYKKGITPGNYKVLVNELAQDKYSGYTLPAEAEKVEVRKDIAYKKIDVSDEVKNESEIDVSKEEQKKQEPAVESSLNDTVEWVASTSVTSTYVEVSKNSITDPFTLVMNGKVMRMSGEVKLDQSAIELKVDQTKQLKATHELEDVISTGWNSNDSSIASVDADGLVTAISAGTTTITCTVAVNKETNDGFEEVIYKASCEVTVIREGSNGGNISLSINPSSLTMAEGNSGTAQVSASGVPSGKTLVYSAESTDVGVATASVDKKGKVTVNAVSSGKATIEISANFSDEPINNPPATYLTVTVTEAGSFSLDKTSATVYIGTPVTINAAAAAEATISAKSSDTKVATVSVSGKAITITGVKAGTAKVTVTATVGNSSTSETCAVTVKSDPKNDTTTLLKDNSGNQLYVQENNSYREAVYADYYKDGVKFFKKGDTKYTGWQTIDGKVYFFDKNGKKVTGEQIIQGAKYNFASDGSLVNSTGTMGIDVSKHNATIDWNAVKNSGVSFVIIRCGYRGYTQGSLVIDPKFKENIKGANAAGLKVGVYFFSQAVDEVEAVQEASFVLDAVKGYKVSYPIYLDVEYSGAAGNSGRADGLSKSTRTAVCKAFCATIQSGGYTAGVYANKNWLEEKLDPGQLGSYKIWLAQYAASPSYKGRYDMWQYKSTGKVSGITGNVDMNISYLGY